MESKARTVLWVTVWVLLIWYVLYYYRPPRQIAVLQTTLADFSFDLLLQRQPVVVYDQVADWVELQRLWFPRNRTRISSHHSTDTWTRSYAKYLLIQPEHDGEVYLYPAGKKLVEGRPGVEETLLTIKLRARQILLLPYRWHYCCAVGPYSTMHVDDWLTPWLPAF